MAACSQGGTCFQGEVSGYFVDIPGQPLTGCVAIQGWQPPVGEGTAVLALSASQDCETMDKKKTSLEIADTLQISDDERVGRRATEGEHQIACTGVGQGILNNDVAVSHESAQSPQHLKLSNRMLLSYWDISSVYRQPI